MRDNINNIVNEVNIIIKNKNKYNVKTILYALGVREQIETMKSTCIIDPIFIQLLEYLKSYISCYIDMDLLKYVCLHKKKIILPDESLTSSNGTNSSASSSQEDLNGAIEKMIISDSIAVNKIIESSNDKSKQLFAEKIFNLLDFDKNGYITALDIINSKISLETSYMIPLIDCLIKDPNGVDFDGFIIII